MQQSTNKQRIQKNIWSWNHTFKTKEIATSKILANQFLFAGAGNSLASTQPTLMYACMVFSWLYKCAQKGHFCQYVLCIRYCMVWYYSSFASKPMKIDERYGFITICWQWDQSTYFTYFCYTVTIGWILFWSCNSYFQPPAFSRDFHEKFMLRLW